MRLTIIVPDGVVGLDGLFFKISGLAEMVPPGLHALQWYGDKGEEELPGENRLIDSLDAYQGAIAAWEEAKLDAAPKPPTLDEIKARKSQDIDAACEAAIISGFSSAALGSPHQYQSDRDDQLNLIGMAADGLGGLFKCRDEAGAWAFRPHTNVQLTQVITDGKAVKLALLQRCAALKAQVADAPTAAVVAGIGWA